MLLEQDRPFKFDEDCLKNFVALKKALVTAPVVIALDQSMPFKLMCDVRNQSVGAMLRQRKDKIFTPFIMLTRL